MKKKRKDTLAHRLVELISEPQFIKFEHMLSEPNIFKIVGRTHYERWHSCFWGWLLDASGSHLLSEYSLIRMLFLLVDDKCMKAKNHEAQNLWNALPTIDFSEIEVTPNENTSVETSVAGVGRFDIFLTAKFADGLGYQGRLNLVIEMKIDSKPNGKQAKKYADWLFEKHSDDVNLLIQCGLCPQPNYVSPSAVWRIRFAKGGGDLGPSAGLPHLRIHKYSATRGAPTSSPSLPCFCESASGGNQIRHTVTSGFVRQQPDFARIRLRNKYPWFPVCKKKSSHL